MLDEKKLKEYDQYLFDREERRLKGTLTKEELEEEAAIEAEKNIVGEFFKKIKE